MMTIDYSYSNMRLMILNQYDTNIFESHCIFDINNLFTLILFNSYI